MKSLDQVEPRTPIDATHTPGDASNEAVISQPGSYYLTGNLIVTKANGIHVAVAGVTIDLNGFQISRTASVIGRAITIDDIAHRCTVKNGFVAGPFSIGVDCRKVADAAHGGAFVNVAVSGCDTAGFRCGTGWHVDGCRATDMTSGAVGFETVGNDCVLTNCAAASNGGHGFLLTNGCSLENCVAFANTGSGFISGTACVLHNCVARNNLGPSGGFNLGLGSTVTQCNATSNTNNGIVAANGSIINGCTARSNNTGIVCANDCVIKDSTAQGNSADGISSVDRCEIVNCASNSNGTGAAGSGIVAGLRTVVRNCSASANQNNGIVILGASLVLENNVGQNGVGGAAAGIDSSGGSGSRIEANIVRNNTGTGILGASNDVIIRNYSFSNTTNYNPATGANFGPIELPSTSTHPTANF